MSAPEIWKDNDCDKLRKALKSYTAVIDAQGSERLSNLETWYSNTLPASIKEREVPHITLDDLQGVTAWKMRRGVWRERNWLLVGSNDPEKVIEASRSAVAAAPDPRQPLTILSKLSGVGAATASAVMSAYMPEEYPFFDELVAAQIPGLGPMAFTLKYYLEYARLIRERAKELTEICEEEWTPRDVSNALWAVSGGKIQHPELK